MDRNASFDITRHPALFALGLLAAACMHALIAHMIVTVTPADANPLDLDIGNALRRFMLAGGIADCIAAVMVLIVRPRRAR